MGRLPPAHAPLHEYYKFLLKVVLVQPLRDVRGNLQEKCPDPLSKLLSSVTVLFISAKRVPFKQNQSGLWGDYVAYIGARDNSSGHVEQMCIMDALNCD